MAYHLQARNGTAAAWTSANPTLAQGEIAVETDTGQIKFGDGVTVYNSLAYQSTTGGSQTAPYRNLGDGSDGNVTISSGTTTLSRDMFYNNLTMSGTGQISTNGFKIYVKGILNLSAAALGAINFNGAAGGNASGLTGGTSTTVPVTGSVGTQGQSTAGTTGNTGAGSSSTALSALTGMGGISNTSGAGGAGGNAGGAGRGGATPTSANLDRFATNFLKGITLLGGGQAGAGGASGGGDNTNNGGGGGGGANGGGILVLYANIIIKSSSTLAGTIQVNGGTGGNGGNGDSAGVTGGGGGGSGGAGGYVYLAYNSLAGPSIAGLIQASGGMGGTGGNGFGGGGGGNGGLGGYGGRIYVYQIPTGIGSESDAITNAIYNPEVTSGNIASGSLGGLGGFSGMRIRTL